MLLNSSVQCISVRCEYHVKGGCLVNASSVWGPINHRLFDAKTVSCSWLTLHYKLYPTLTVSTSCHGPVVHQCHLGLMVFFNKDPWVYREESCSMIRKARGVPLNELVRIWVSIEKTIIDDSREAPVQSDFREVLEMVLKRRVQGWGKQSHKVKLELEWGWRVVQSDYELRLRDCLVRVSKIYKDLLQMIWLGKA